MDFNSLSTEMRNNADYEKAARMKAYMREQFNFLGIPKPMRREILKPYLSAVKDEKKVDWKFIERCWREPFREYQYAAMDYLSKVSKQLTPMDVTNIKRLIVTKSWWDTVDGLDEIMGVIAMRFPEAKQILLDWSKDENFWLRRAAIDHQLRYKDKTDTKLFEKILINNLCHTEFFVNKAIGWSLREYSKTNPDWVRAFVNKHRSDMASVSIREASKYI